MTIQLYAQPYDLTATGFYFETADQYFEKVKHLTNVHGDPVEEFEIQFINGDDIDCELAKAIGINQANFSVFLDCVETWEDWEKINVIIAVGECGYDFGPDDSPDSLGVDIYGAENLRELAEQFVEDGLFGDIPESLQLYIDFDAIAHDLAVEYSETTIAGECYVYACR